MSEWNPKANEIFLEALDLTGSKRQEAFLDEACGSNHALREQVESLLKADSQAPSILDEGVAQLTVDYREPDYVGAQIGPYKVREKIAEGGFGVVFVAQQTRPLRRKVALKIIKPGMDTKDVIARFESERQALALMDHPNIAKVLDAGVIESGRPYFAMELVQGVSITEFCDEQRLSTAERLRLFIDVCRAVQHAHQKGVIHRDLKPSNVMVTMHDHQPVPKVIDFGIAKAIGSQLTDKTIYTGYGQMVGTPMYMSPEQTQMSGLDVDTRSDVYCLGVLLYELLTGTTPFDRESIRNADFDEIRRIIRHDEPPRPSNRVNTLDAHAQTTVAERRRIDAGQLGRSLRGELDWIVMKALEKDRSRRYDSANMFAEDVQHYLDDQPVVACPPSYTYRLRKTIKRHKRLATTVFLVVAVLIACTIFSFHQARLANDALATTREHQRQLVESLLASVELRSESYLAYGRRLLSARRMTLGADGRVYVADSAQSSVVSVSPDHSSSPTEFVEPRSGGLRTPIDVRFGPDANLYVASAQTHAIHRYDGRTGQFLGVFIPEGRGGLRRPSDIAYGPDGCMLVTSDSRQILRYDASDGSFLGVAVHEDKCPRMPRGIVFGPNARFYVAGFDDNRIYSYDAHTYEKLDEASLGRNHSGPTSMAFGPDGYLYVPCLDSNAVLKIDPENMNNVEEFVTSSNGGLHAPTDIVFTPDGRLYVLSWFGDEILKYKATDASYLGPVITAKPRTATAPELFQLAILYWELGELERAKKNYFAGVAWMETHRIDNTKLRQLRGKIARMLLLEDN